MRFEKLTPRERLRALLTCVGGLSDSWFGTVAEQGMTTQAQNAALPLVARAVKLDPENPDPVELDRLTLDLARDRDLNRICCLWCGRPFTRAHTKGRYCSPYCRLKVFKQKKGRQLLTGANVYGKLAG